MASKFGGVPVSGSKFGGVPVSRTASVRQEDDERTLGDSVNDFVANFGIGTGQVVSLLGSAYGLATGDMENRLTASGARTSEFWEKRRTPAYKEAERARQEKIDAAEGELQKAGVAIWETLSNPMLLVGELAKQVPNLAVSGAGGAGGKVVVGTAGKVFGREVSKQALTRAGAAAATGTGVGLSSADFGQSAYEQLMSLPDEVWLANPQVQERIGGNMDLFPQVKREIARGLAQNSAIAGGLVTYGLNKLPGAKTIEKALGGEALTGTRLRRAATGFAGETLSEGLEEGATQLTANIAQAQIDPNARLTTGLGQAAGLGAVTGGGLGLISGALAPGREMTVEPVEELKFGEPQVAPAEVSAEQASDFARTRLEELISKGRGTPDTEAVDPVTGQKRTVPGRPAQFLSDNEKAELAFLVNNVRDPNAIADAYNLKIKASADQRLNEATNVADAIQAAADMVDLDIEALEREAGISTFAEPAVTAQAVTEPAVTAQAVIEPGLTVDVLSRADISAMPAPERQEFLSDLTAARTANLPEQREQALARAAETYGRTVGPIQQPTPRATPAEAISAAQERPAARPEPTAAPDLNALLAADTRSMDEESRADFNAQLSMARANAPGPVQTAALTRAAEIYSRTVGPIQTRQQAQPAAAGAAAPSRRTPVPRPTRILGRPTATYTDDQLSALLDNNDTPAVTRRGIEIELRARADVGQAPAGGTFAPTMAPTQEGLNNDRILTVTAAMPDLGSQPLAGQPAGRQARAAAQTLIDSWASNRGEASPVVFGDPDPADEASFTAIADLLGELTGAKVVAFSDTSENAINGVNLGGYSLVNVGRTQAGVAPTGLHEVTHHLEKLAAAERAQGKTGTPAQDYVDQIYEIFDDMTDEGKRAYVGNFLYKDELDGIADPAAREARLQELLQSEELRSEMVSDFMGNRATDREFMEGLAKADPQGFEAFVKRWLAAIDSLLAKLRGVAKETESKKVDSYIRDLNRAKLTAQSALINYRKATAAPAAAGVESPAFKRQEQARDETPSFSRRSSVAWMKDPSKARKQLGLPATGKVKARALGEAINRVVAADFGAIPADDRSAEVAKELARAMADEVRYQVKDANSGLGWYSANYPAAVRRLQSRFPELADDAGAQNVFTAILAITSNGEKVRRNLAMATEMYGKWREGATFVSAMPGSRRAPALENNAALLDALLDEHGLDGLRDHLLEELTVKEINAQLRAAGKAAKTAYTADTVMPRAALYFGPKLGAFYANLAGAEGYLTMDLWWSRSINRYRANLLPSPTEQGADRLREMLGLPADADLDTVIEAAKPYWQSYKDRNYKQGTALEKASNTFIKAAMLELNEAPENATDRKFMASAAREAQRLLRRQGLKLSIADIQAALWYYEKRLYAALGVRGRDDIGYEEAINEWATESDRPAGRFTRRGGERRGRSAAARTGSEADLDVRFSRGQDRRGAETGGFTRQERRIIGERAVIQSRANRAGNAQQPRAYAGDGGKDGKRFRVLKSLGVTYTQLWKPGRDLGNVFRANSLALPEFFELAPTIENATKFRSAITENKANHPFGAAVFVYPAEDYQGMRLFLAKDGKSGVAVKPDGDIVSVFSTGGAGRAIMELAVSVGGRKLDAFDTILPEFYAPHGFRAVARTRWNDEYAPEGWDKETFREFNNGEPDVVFMVYDPSKMDAEYSKKDGEVTDYDRAVALQKRNMPAFSRAQDPSAADEVIAFSKRQKPAPKKTITAYKLFRVDLRRPGQIFPLFVNANDPVPFGEWQDADIGPLGEGGKVKSKLGLLAFRPGWHAGDLPIATHIGQKSDSSLRAPDQRADNQVWAEVELAADRDWQKVADERGKNAQGKIIAARAHITDQVPEDGFYRYKTSPNMVGKWLISGSMKVNRLLSDAEVASINSAAGTADLPRAKPFDAEKYGFDAPQFSRAQTPEFKRWFGDSKAVIAFNAETGQPVVSSREPKTLVPQVMYHTTRNDFSEFEIGRISTNSGTFGDWETSRAAAFVTPDVGASQAYGTQGGVFANGANVMPLYVKAENPLDLTSGISEQDAQRLIDAGMSERFVYNRLGRWEMFDGEQGRETVDVIKRAGYDSVIFNDENPNTGDSFEAWALFEPNQIKSAIGNVGAFNPADPRITFSRAQKSPLKLYSALTRAAEQGPAKAPASQWPGLLRKQKGVTLAEIKWTGLEEWLSMQTGQVAREDVVAFLSNNGVQVGEVVLGQPKWRVFNANIRDSVDFNTEAEARQYAADNDVPPVEVFPMPETMNPLYDYYTLPGVRSNYREVLLVLPTAPSSNERYIYVNPQTGERSREPGSVRQENPDYRRDWYYQSGHWPDVPNVLAHVRVNDRVDADGNRVLFVEELQSDWAQEGRQEGFAKPADYEVREGKFKDRFEVYQKSTGNKIEFPGGIVAFSTRDAAEKAIKEMSPERAYGAQAGIPTAPFVESTDNWLRLALKRVIAMAVEGGYSKVAFTTGEQNAKRYSMDTVLRELAYASDGEGLYEIYAIDTAGTEVIDEDEVPLSRIEELVGKEIAEKIANAEGELAGGGYREWRYLRGVDLLKVEAKGMRAFYDSIVPKTLNKLLPTLGGGRVETVEIVRLNAARRDELLADIEAEEGRPRERTYRLTQPGFDITPAMVDQVHDVGLPLFSRAQNIFGNPLPAGSLGLPDTKMDEIIYYLQDKLVDTKRVVEKITAATGAIADKWDPYLQEKLFHGRTAEQTLDFANNELKPLIEALGRNKVSIEDFDEYLHNRHAEERNAEIAKINPALPDAGSGIPTADARAYLAALPSARRAMLEGLAKRVDAINAGTRKILVDTGLESQSLMDTWQNKYGKYVPLMREELDFDPASGSGIGQGFSVRGSASKRATGSANRKVVDILANIAMQREKAIVRGEKNKVSQAMYGLAIQNPDGQLWLPVNPSASKDPAILAAELTSMGLDPLDAQNIAKEPTQSVVDPRTGLVSTRVNTLLRNAETAIGVRVNGQQRYLLLNSQDPRAERMARAMKNLDADQLGRAMSLIAKGTRWFASVNTQYNPIFGVINFMRDVQGGVLNLSSTELAGEQGAVLAGTMPALRGIYGDLRSGASGQWATLWKEFQKVGGQTGYRSQFSQFEERAEALRDELKALNDGTGKKVGKAVGQWLSDYNTAMENAVRLSAYKTALDRGMSKERAAALAKDLTVNFNKKGQAATQMGALYAFFNASVQGTTRLAQTLSGPAGKKIVYGGLLLGAAQALAMAAAGFDEDEPPDFIRERNIIIPTGGGKYITIPMPLGFNVIPNTSRILTEWALSGFERTPQRVAQMATAFFEMFNPIGNAGISMQTAAPTVADPLVALFENRDWTGTPIAREDFNSLDPTPGYTRAKDTASVWSKFLSYYLNLATGGTEFAPGVFSPTPDQIDYLIGQVGGGIGREASKIEQTISSALTGEELPPFKVPLVGRLYGDTTGSSAVSSRFYENLRRMNIHNNEITGRREAGRPIGDYLRENPEARLAPEANRVYRQVQNLRRRKRELLERDASRESIRAIEKQITTRMERFNARLENR